MREQGYTTVETPSVENVLELLREAQQQALDENFDNVLVIMIKDQGNEHTHSYIRGIASEQDILYMLEGLILSMSERSLKMAAGASMVMANCMTKIASMIQEE